MLFQKGFLEYILHRPPKEVGEDDYNNLHGAIRVCLEKAPRMTDLQHFARLVLYKRLLNPSTSPVAPCAEAG